MTFNATNAITGQEITIVAQAVRYLEGTAQDNTLVFFESGRELLVSESRRLVQARLDLALMETYQAQGVQK